MAQSGSDAGVDLRVRTYLVDKLKLMHQRLVEQHGRAGGEPCAADTGGLLEYLPVAVLTLDLEGRFLYMNRRAEQLTGYSLKDLAGRAYYETELLRFRDLIRVAAVFGRARGEKRTRPFRLAYRSKDGEARKLEASLHLVPRGESVQILLVAREMPPRPGARADERQSMEDAGERAAVPLSLCMFCKRVEDVDGDWIPMEYFLYKRLELEFVHQACPDCQEKKARGEIP